MCVCVCVLDVRVHAWVCVCVLECMCGNYNIQNGMELIGGLLYFNTFPLSITGLFSTLPALLMAILHGR